MTKLSAVNSNQTAKARSDRLGLGSFEPPKSDSYSRQNVRADFFRSLDMLEQGVVSTLYEKAFFQFILFAWGRFSEAVPPPVSTRLEDENFLLELERVVKDFSASPYNPETRSFHPAFIELLAPPFGRDREMVLNHQREVLMMELLHPFEKLEGDLGRAFRNSKALQRMNGAEPLYETLLKWSQDWNLDADWCRDYAVASLCVWLSDRWSRWDETLLSLRQGVSEVLSDKLWYAYVDTSLPTDESITKSKSLIDNISSAPHFHFSWREIDFQTPRWNPIMSYRDDWVRNSEAEFITYLTRRKESGSSVPVGTLKRFRAARDEYLRQIERKAPRVGLVKTPRRWANEHLIWTARFQVQKWPLSKIEKTYSKPRKTIADGISRTLNFIGLKRRPDLRHGMPKGTRLSANRRIVRN